MCRVQDGFRLCTCEDDEPQATSPTWLLQRRDKRRPGSTKRGKVAVPRFSEAAELARATLLAGLNAGDCFDFSYTPTEGDVLVVTLEAEGKPLRFRYESAGWKVDTSNLFVPWRGQMVNFAAGKIQ